MPRTITALEETPQRITRSHSCIAAATSATDDRDSPPCDSGLLCDLNSGIPFSNASPASGDRSISPVLVEDKLLKSLEEDDVSCSSDETWTPLIDGEDSDDDNVDDDGTSWQETPVQYKDFSIFFNKVDTDLERGYFEEVKELRKRVLREFDTLSSENTKRKSSLNANKVMNAVYNTDILFSVLTF
jgi:hypothetical protein